MTDYFTYKKGRLFCEGVPVERLAEQYGTPLYIYSRNHLVDRFRSLSDATSALDPLVCYSVKANSNKSVIETFLGCDSGLDIVSGGELFRALRAGADASKIVFAGVGKTREEIEYALENNILFFTVESEPEAQRISECAHGLDKVGRIAFRVNPNVDAKTHKYITTGKKENKFGLGYDEIISACARASKLPAVEIVGLHMHIGSQILAPEPFARAVEKVAGLCSELKDRFRSFAYLDIGGGLGIRYKPEDEPISDTDYAAAIVPALSKLDLKIVLEPGRSLVGNAGILVCRVQYVKEGRTKKFVIVDAAMNDLLRPPLYEAYHEIVAVRETKGSITCDVVGPVCESGDFMAQDRDIPEVGEDDLLALKSAGAYGFTMASNYNSRPRPAEVMVDGDSEALARKRESWDDMARGEG